LVETARKIIRFGLFELDSAAGELRKQGLKIRLADQPLQILLLLLERPGDVVTREAVRQRLWPAETFVDFDAGLNTAIKKLRDALGDPAENPRFVETLPRRGYRFIAPIETRTVSPPDSLSDNAPAGEVAAHAKRAGLPSWLWAAATAVAVLVFASAWLIVAGWREQRSRSDVTAPAEIKSIVILPFENLSGDPEQEYFADGMTEALTTRLAQIRALRVISRTSAEQYKRAKKSLPEVARELNVDAVVEGAVVRSGDRVRVTAQLIEAANDRHLWAQSYERELHDVLVLQADLARAIADAVQVEVRPGEQRRLLRTQAVHPDAYEAYLWGRFYLKQRTRAALLKAAEQFQRAIEKDPTYAAAHSGLADTYRQSGLVGLPPREGMPKAEAAARQALALDDTLAEGHASLAGVLYLYHWSWLEAEKEFRRSLDLDPNYAEGHRAYAIYLLMLDRPEEAVSEARHAQELSPLDETINNELGTALARAGRYDEAIAQLQKTRERIPKSPRAYAGLAEVYARQGDWSRAIATYEEGRLGPAPWLGYMYAVSGRRPEALHVLAAIEKRAQQDYVTPQTLAIVQLGLGRKDQALTLLEKAYDDRAFEVLGFPLLSDLLRDEPRFQDLRRRMGLASRSAALPPSVGEAYRKR
jgi:TolB-like protein/DNA-binding winged helix-turn-helix (wHTH) protein/Flp pilus assembly protein TadD